MKSKKIKTVFISIIRSFKLIFQASPLNMIVLIFISLMLSLLPLAVIYLTKLLIDIISKSIINSIIISLKDLIIYILLLSISWLLQSAFSSLKSSLTNLLRFKVETYSQIKIMDKCNDLDIAFFENNQNLDALEKASRGAVMSAWNLINLLLNIIQIFIILIGYLLILAKFNWIIPIILIITTLPQLIAVSHFAKVRWKMDSDRTEETRLRYYILDLMSHKNAAKEIKLFDLHDFFITKFQLFTNKFFKQEGKFIKRQELVNFLLGQISTAVIIVVWVYIIFQAINKLISIGDIFLYTQAVNNCYSNLLSLFSTSGELYQQILFLNNYFDFIDMKPKNVAGSLSFNDKRWGDFKQDGFKLNNIEFRNVSFYYPGTEKYILKNISFKINNNETTAIAGKNGAGKTTIIKLLTRLYDPVEGNILINGVNVKEFDLKFYRKLIGVIFQDFVKYILPAKENIGMGQVENIGNLDKIKEAARKSKVDTLIETFPDKYNTYLERQFTGLGVDLSGGEWQKIALARGFMREAEILIMDEPTSSLDAVAEYEINNYVNTLLNQKTCIFVSHRFSSIRIAQKILVINNGEIIDEGSHNDLMEKKGLYYEMYQLQAEGYK